MRRFSRIDGADSKDLDDAISLSKYEDFYVLGVHIADVSYYVREKTALDEEALRRGTSNLLRKQGGTHAAQGTLKRHLFTESR